MAQDSGGTAQNTLWNTPLEETNIDVRLRRILINAGIRTLGEAFDLTDQELDNRIGPDATDEILLLAESYERDPTGFTRRVTGKKTPNHKTTLKPAGSIIASTARKANVSRASKHQSERTRYAGQLPSCNESRWLISFERKARAAISVVADHAEDAFIAEALGAISGDMIELRLYIKSIFTMSQKSSPTGSSIAAARGLMDDVPDSFLLYMLDSVQRNFTGNSAWKPALAELGVKDFQTEQVIPRLLYERIGYWGFRTYEESETSLQYFYTMLLHAGLAASDWESIWSRLMLPLAKDMRKGKLPGGSYPTADELIKLANDKYSGYYLANRSAQNLISKAPEIIGGLLTSALSVATTLFDSSTGDGDQVMMSSELLPSLAMEALRSVLSAEGSRTGKRASQIVYFPPAQLRLEPSDGESPIVLYWDRTRFPKEYIGRTVTYRVNGERYLEAEVLSGVDSAVLEEASISLKPERAYDVEVELSAADNSQLGRLYATQSFRANRPGVYEFLRTSDGTVRQKVRPLRRRRDVVCLVAPGFRVVPKAGMTLVNTDSLPGGYSIQTFDMEVMGCGEVLGPRGEQASAWCEGFKATVDRSQVIGEGKGGSDLYPFIGTADGDSYNAALPSIEIEGLTEGFNDRQLEIECTCDGRRVSIKRTTVDKPGLDRAKSVILRLDQSMVRAFVNEGNLKVRHKESGNAILSYRFAVIPVRRIALESARITSNDDVMATYAVIVDRACEIRRGTDASRAYRSAPRYVDAPLSDEWLSATVSPVGDGEDPSVEAHVFLAGISVSGPKATRGDKDIMADRYDLAEMPDSYGTLCVECKGRRTSRGAYLSLGAVPKFYKKLPVASSYRITPFSPLPGAWGEDGETPTELALAISYECGFRSEESRSSCTLDLGSLLLGYGFGRCRLVSTATGRELRLDRPVDYDLAVRLTKVLGGRESPLGEVISLPAGETSIPLPREASEALVGRRHIVATFAAEDVFGDVDFADGQRIEIRRQ